jgi:hypothetical protein
MPPESLGTAVTVAALALAAWCAVPAVRNRAIGVSHWSGLGAVEALVVAEAVAGIIHLAGGAHPRQYVTFIGYLVAFLIVLPLAGLLARLEPTRWGAVIVTVGALVLPVLVIRLNQLWAGGA